MSKRLKLVSVRLKPDREVYKNATFATATDVAFLMAKEKHIFPVVGAMCFKWHPSVQEGFAFVDLSGYSILKRASVVL